MNKPLLPGVDRLLRHTSAQRSIVWCQIGICSVPAPASVYDGSSGTCGGRQNVEKIGQTSARKVFHTQSKVAAICNRAGSYAATSMSYLTHTVGSPRARARDSHAHDFGEAG